MKIPSTSNMSNHPLDRYTESVRRDQPSAGQSDRAQRRLMARLDESRQAKRSTAGPWRWAAAAALAILVLPLLLMLPSPNGSIAFAQVQSYFTDFQTMKARMTTQMNGETVLAMDIFVDEQDRVRLDSGDSFSFIIDPDRELMLQLFHQHRRAVRVPLESDAPDEPAQALDWLQQIRQYQGQARLIDEVRLIDGVEAFGFRLTDQAVDMTLWASDRGRPILLEMQTGPEGAAARTQIRFSFDQPVDPQRFSLDVPAGYSVAFGYDED